MPKNNTQITGQAIRLQQWLQDVLLPLWQDPQVTAPHGFICEALDARSRPAPTTFHRTLVCARQAFFFLRLSRPARTDLRSKGLAYLDHLLNRYIDPAHGGFARSIRPDGTVHDGDRHLYTLAFVVLACAEGFAQTRQRRYVEAADAVLKTVHDAFWSPRDGAFHARVSADGSTALEPPAQNPHMHLFEAVSALWQASGEPRHAAHVIKVAHAVDACFFDPDRAAVLELARTTPWADNWIEPGHQFEWFSLVSERADLLGRSAFAAHIQQAFAAAKRHGIDAADGLVPMKMSVDWRTTDASHRVWTQLEMIRALATEVRLDPRADASLLASALDALFRWYLHDGGWHEALSQGRVVRSEMPASTPYHFIGAIEELQRLAAA